MEIPIRKNLLYYSSIIYLVILNTQILLIEPTFISPLKVGLMAMAPLLLFATGLVISKAMICGLAYWLLCFFPALLQGNMRFSTLGYLGMFIFTFIVYYTTIFQGAFTLLKFKKILRCLILAYTVFLILQQLFSLIGIGHFLLINLASDYQGLEKFRSLSLEPSHSAVILSFAYLCYLRCCELDLGRKPMIRELFSGNHRWLSIGFLWTMTTMGSGTAYLALMAFTLYFVKLRSIVPIITGLVLLFALAANIDNKQLNRATKVLIATITGDTKKIAQADGSGATRIVPLINTFTKLDFSDSRTWFGHGTLSDDPNSEYSKAWKNMGKNDWFVLPTVRQYGLLAFIVSIILVYVCCIKRFWSLETLFWFTLGMATLGNVYFHWGTIMMLTAIRYFQEQEERNLIIEK